MGRWLLCILVVICGCNNSSPNPPTSVIAAESRYPVIAGDVEVVVGEAREIIAPPGSGTAGSRWIEHTVTYTNKSNRAIWVVGYSEDSPFCGIETRSSDAAEWHDYGLGYCGTGAQEFEISPNATHSFNASLPEKFVGDEFRVLVPYFREHAGQQEFQAASQSRWLTTPA